MTPVDSDSPRWRGPRESDCLWVKFGDDVVVYHRPSGKTHLVNTASLQLLTETLREPRSLESIVSDFEAMDTASDGTEGRRHWLDLLLRLEQLGLVERA